MASGGIDRREPLDLASVVKGALHVREDVAAAEGLHIEAFLRPALISGDRRLIERLVSNLLENALHHNAPSGRVRVSVKGQEDTARLAIVNTGPLVPAEEVQRLLQPFQRLTADRIGHGGGIGLGLSIVAAIADAHGAALSVTPGAEGGLDIEVRFPLAAADSSIQPEPGQASLEHAPLGVVVNER